MSSQPFDFRGMLRKDKPCRDYQTVDGCRRGESCKYGHFSGGDGVGGGVANNALVAAVGGGGGGGGVVDTVRVCRKCGAKVTGPFLIHKEICPNKIHLHTRSTKVGSYFLCIRLPEDIDSMLHSFVDSQCVASELLDNHGCAASKLRDNHGLHITFTLRIPCDVSSEEEGI